MMFSALTVVGRAAVVETGSYFVPVVDQLAAIGGVAVHIYAAYEDIHYRLVAAECEKPGIVGSNSYEYQDNDVYDKTIVGGTYVLMDKVTGHVMRGGRTNNLERRRVEHARDEILGKYRFQVDRYTNSYDARRGREQIIHELYNPPLDKISPMWKGMKREKWDRYMKAGRDLG